LRDESENVNSDLVTAELQARVRERVRAELLRHGASAALDDPELYTDVDRLLRAAIDRSRPRALLLTELLGDPDRWHLETAVDVRSHRGAIGTAIVFVKRRVVLPVVRFLFDYSRDNFERQERVNLVLFACIQELAIENAALRRRMPSP
jgi:hypothetical protein